jgi:two-component system, LytTR family, sensor kinase
MRKEILLNIIIWLVFTGLNLLAVYYNTPWGFNVWVIIMNNAAWALIFYFYALFLLPRFYVTRKYFYLTVGIILSAAIYMVIDYFIEFVFEVKFYHTKWFMPTFTNFVIPLSWFYIQYALFGFGYFYAKQGIKKERELRLVEKENAQLENAFLRAQINPHFLFNTLGFVYNTIKDSSVEAGNSILILSDMMHYSITKSEADGFVLLEEEVEQIENLISIHQLRFNQSLHIHFERTGEANGIRIIPHVLFTLVENALKYGVLKDPDNPLSIKLETNKEMIGFLVSNGIAHNPVVVSNGIGLSNIEKRLFRSYGNNFTLKVKQDKLFYSSELTLPALGVTNHPK